MSDATTQAAPPSASTSPDAGGGKPDILKESRFTVEEGLPYRIMRGGAIWMNKLFFASLILLAVWLVLAGAGGIQACAEGIPPAANATAQQEAPTRSCNVFLTPTSVYLASMALVTFVLSITFGLLGLLVGKKVVEAAAAAQEVGARRDTGKP